MTDSSPRSYAHAELLGGVQRRQAASGALTATRAGGEVVPASEYRAL